MVSDRSYENMRAGQQRYAVIEFCANAETAWGKIESGKYDWLGMKRSTFIFGRPPAGRGFSGSGAMTIGAPGDDGTPAGTGHVVEVRVPRGSAPMRHLHATADAARADYRETVARLAERDGTSGLFRVRLLTDGAFESEELVVRLLPNVL